MPGRANSRADRVDLRRDDAQVLGDERQAAELRFERVQELAARPRHPPARLGRRRPRRDVPVRLEPAEVVEPDQVDLLQDVPHPIDPPGDSRSLAWASQS